MVFYKSKQPAKRVHYLPSNEYCVLEENAAKPELNITTDGGFGLWFMKGGPYFGIVFGGGTIFPLHGSRFSIPAEIPLGTILTSESTTLQIAVTGGMQFSLP